MRSRMFSWLAVVFMVSVSSVWAFPNWMGVYDHYQRHDGGNPGRFVIMMNQSYVGLEANVGYRVNGGSWTEYAMSYVADVDGNSVWEYIPAQPFPFGATVEFYFHGYDTEPANQIYDSRESQNYFSGPLAWADETMLPMFSVYPGNNLQPAAFASGDDALYVAFAYPSVNTNFAFWRKPAGRDWKVLDMPNESSPVGTFDLAALGRNVVLAYQLDTNILVRASDDAGDSWTDSIRIDSIPANGSLAGLSAASDGCGGFAVAYGIATNCCGAQNIFVTVSTNGGSAWSAPVAAFQFHDIGAYATGLKLAGNAAGWYLAVREVYQGSSIIMLGGASTNGQQWITTHLGGDGNAWSEYDIAAGSNTVLISADPYYNNATRVWQSAPGGGWTTQSISRALESGSQIWLGTDFGNTFYLYRYEDNDASPSTSTYLPTYRVSTDGGATWSYPRAVAYDKPAVNNSVSLREVIGSPGPVQQLLWFHNDYVSMFQRMYSYWMQDSHGFRESLSVTQWNGQVVITATNLTPGMNHALEFAPAAVGADWTNLTALSHGATNLTLNAPGGDGLGLFRVKSTH